MHITKINIENFKCFKRLSLSLNEGLNILVGDNEAGKSTILEAIHLALSGLVHGRYIKNELTQYLFNMEAVDEYVKGLEAGTALAPPRILIEIFFSGENLSLFEGDGNSEKRKDCGVALKIEYSDKYKSEYEDFVRKQGIKTIPIEYYTVSLSSFARDESITNRIIPLKSALIDSSHSRSQNGSDLHLSHILHNFLDDSQRVNISRSHREMRDFFMGKDEIRAINDELAKVTKISADDKAVTLSVELSARTMWENSLLTCLDNVPFHHIGKGEQSIVKTKLALVHKRVKEANVVLLEEPENHLSHTKLNQLIHNIKEKCDEKQIIISTHSSFVANKLGLDSLILLHEGVPTRLSELEPSTEHFFKTIPGYDTLRLLLCKKAILVEGDADELILQRAYKDAYDGRLPIEDCIDVISVGTSFMRFLEIAEKIMKPVTVVTDNDGDPDTLKKKYEKHMKVGSPTEGIIKICFDEVVDEGDLRIGLKKTKPFNYNTLEPKLLKVNSLQSFNRIFGKEFSNIDEMHVHMRANKTECALKLFETKEKIQFPDYIKDAIK